MIKLKALVRTFILLIFVSIYYAQEKANNHFTVKSIFNVTVAEIISTNEHMTLNSKGATAIFKSPPSFEKLKYSEKNLLRWLLETETFQNGEQIVDGEWKKDKEMFENQQILYRFLLAPDSENKDSAQTMLFRLDIKKEGDIDIDENKLNMNYLILNSSSIQVYINKSDYTLNKILLDYGVMPIKIIPNEK